jgi:hypothetical protein
MAVLKIDDENKIFSAVAEGIVSGGQMVVAGSYTSTVTSNAMSVFSYDKIKVSQGGSGTTYPIGIALDTVASGTSNAVSVIRKLLTIVAVNGNVGAGDPIVPVGNNASNEPIVAPVGAGVEEAVIGRAYTEAASGGYCIAWLDF